VTQRGGGGRAGTDHWRQRRVRRGKEKRSPPVLHMIISASNYGRMNFPGGKAEKYPARWKGKKTPGCKKRRRKENNRKGSPPQSRSRGRRGIGWECPAKVAGEEGDKGELST